MQVSELQREHDPLIKLQPLNKSLTPLDKFEVKVIVTVNQSSVHKCVSSVYITSFLK